MGSKAKRAAREAGWRAGFRAAPARTRAPARLDVPSVTSENAGYSVAAANLPEIIRVRPDATEYSSTRNYVRPQ
ncbi:protein of unknown function [Caballeronia sp. S22]